MSHPQPPNPAAPSPTPGEAAEQAKAARREAGALLRAAREAAGRGVAELATQLKVSPDKIGALESGDWSTLHDDAYARGLLRAAAKALRTDVDAVLRPLPPAFVRGTPIIPPVSGNLGPARAATVVGAQGGTRRLVRLALLLVVLALLLLYLPRNARLGGWIEDLAARLGLHGAAVTGTTVHPDAGPGANPGKSASAASALTTPDAAPSAASAAASQPARPAASQPAAARGAREQGAAASEPAARAQGQAAAASAPAASGPAGPALALSASGQSWVEVRAQSGKVLFSGMLQPGAAQNLATQAADFPLRVVIGNARQTQLLLGGRAVALGAGGGNVARLVLQASAN